MTPSAPRRGGRPSGGPLTSLFSSATVPELVALLDRLGRQSIDELVQHASVSRVTVSTEINRLAKLGIVAIERVGNRRYVTLDDNPAARAVRALAVLACDVPHAIAAEFSPVKGAEQVLIYGSWAARNAGEHGRLPQDIDVLVVGHTDQDDVFEAAERATRRIGVPVSARRVPTDAWESAADPFLKSLRDRPMLEVVA